MNTSIKSLAKKEPITLSYKVLEVYNNANKETKNGSMNNERLINLLVLGEYLDLNIEDITRFEFHGDDIMLDKINKKWYQCIPYDVAELDVLHYEFPLHTINELEDVANSREDKSYIIEQLKKIDIADKIEFVHTENKGIFVVCTK